MRLFHIAFYVGTLVVAALSSAASAVAVSIERFIDALLSIVPASGPRFAFDGPAMAMDIGGQPLARSTQQSLRHEAGVPHRAADRHI